jgi:hypothetical protein
MTTLALGEQLGTFLAGQADRIETEKAHNKASTTSSSENRCLSLRAKNPRLTPENPLFEQLWPRTSVDTGQPSAMKE